MIGLKTFVQDIVIILAFLGIYTGFQFDLINDEYAISKFIRATLLYMILFGIPMYLCFAFSIRLLRSNILLLLLSCMIVLGNVFLSMYAASEQGMDYTLGGKVIYADGKITLYGFLHKLVSPFLFLVFYAIFRLVKFRFSEN
ncbi:MAG: hypothetical protein J0M34_01040 [Alphaproteobacteria bacterium]|nr:hypothetical protein [Alphaproteobacteria bacterium]